MLITQGSLVRVQPDPPSFNVNCKKLALKIERQAKQGERAALCTDVHKPPNNAASRRRSSFNGGLAQLGEHLLCKQGVNGSIPLSSTIHVVNKSPQELIFKPGPRISRFRYQLLLRNCIKLFFKNLEK